MQQKHLERQCWQQQRPQCQIRLPSIQLVVMRQRSLRHFFGAAIKFAVCRLYVTALNQFLEPFHGLMYRSIFI